jgi:hypothetical protein
VSCITERRQVWWVGHPNALASVVRFRGCGGCYCCGATVYTELTKTQTAGAVVLPCGLASGSAPLSDVGIAGTGSCTPTSTPDSGLDFSIGVSGVGCDSTAGPTTCPMPAGATLAVDFKLNSLPGGLTDAYEFAIQYTNGLTLNGGLTQQGPGVWRLRCVTRRVCSPPVARRPYDPSELPGCATARRALLLGRSRCPNDHPHHGAGCHNRPTSISGEHGRSAWSRANMILGTFWRAAAPTRPPLPCSSTPCRWRDAPFSETAPTSRRSTRSP